MKRFIVIACTFIIVLIMSIGCAPPLVEEDEKEIRITGLGWVIENIDRGFWRKSTTEKTCFYYLSIKYEGDYITASDVEWARINIPGNRYWLFDPLKDLEPEDKYFGDFGFSNSVTPHHLPIGVFEAEIKLKNGSITRFSRDIPAPGNMYINGITHVYTEDYAGVIPSNYAVLPKRAVVKSYSKADTITITFSVEDNLVYSGRVVFFDSNNYGTGYTAYFRDFETGELSSMINNGNGLYTDGTDNTVTISASDITFNEGYSYSDITNFSVKLTDGYQYSGSSSTYDCVSYTAKIDF